MGPLKKLRSLAGKGSWVFSVAPRTRWTVQRLWAVVGVTLAQGAVRTHGGRGGGIRTNLFAVKQVELPLRWIVAYWGSKPSPLKRVLLCSTPHCGIEVVIDACPWGLGGYLCQKSTGRVLEYFASPLTQEDLSLFGHALGDASGQQVWEALAILVALRLWAKHFQAGGAAFQVRGDSVVSLAMASKLSSKSPQLNRIGAEIALMFELWQIEEAITTHTPGRLLVLADYLSRLHAPGDAGTPPAECLRNSALLLSGMRLSTKSGRWLQGRSHVNRRWHNRRCEAFFR